MSHKESSLAIDEFKSQEECQIFLGTPQLKVIVNKRAMIQTQTADEVVKVSGSLSVSF